MDKYRYSPDEFEEKILSAKNHDKKYSSVRKSEETSILLGYHRKKHRLVNVQRFLIQISNLEYSKIMIGHGFMDKSPLLNLGRMTFVRCPVSRIIFSLGMN